MSGKSKASAKSTDMIQYAEPYFHYAPSPYYNESHHAWRSKVRAFVEKELMPHVNKWDEAGDYPLELHSIAYKAGIYGAMWPAAHGGTPPAAETDIFHDLIMIDELSRTGCGGVLWAVFYSFGIALPPILNVGLGNKALQAAVCREVITGASIMALAVTEPNAGSDVAQIQCTCVENPSNADEYLVNGEKYFITSGMKAQYFTVAVRTDATKKGMKGVSLVLIEANRKGVYRSRMKTQGWLTSTTTYVIFKNVVIPKTNLIGKLNDGFRPIMHNFNHERFVFAVMSCRFARVCLEEAVAFAGTRKTFGKRLTEHQVIRHKVAEMVKQIESCFAMIEQLAYKLKCGLSDRQIAGPMALLKVQATKCMEHCAREAVQIFGGRGYIRGGRAAKVERLYREVRVMAIAGGSEEVLMDLAMRQAKL